MEDTSGAFCSISGKQRFDVQLLADRIEAQQRGSSKRTSYALHDVVGATVLDAQEHGTSAAVLKLHAYPAASFK
jgi:hypothetical protein